MASSMGYSDSKIRRSVFRMDNNLLKPVLLKDYLLDDLSSCSSNGFKSFPRRQWCTGTVRFLINKDLDKPTNPKLTYTSTSARRKVHKPRPKTAASATISAFKTASEAVLKLLSVHNKSSVVKSGFLARSFSRKVFKSFWKRSGERQIKDSEINRWKTFHNLISEFPETPTHFVVLQSPTNIIPTTTTTNSTPDSTSIDGDRRSKSSSSWSGDEFCSSEYLLHNTNESGTKSSGEAGGDSVAAAADAPIEKRDWIAKDDKEQFSPVSVLESPFHAEQGDDASSPDFDTKLDRLEGTKNKLMQRLRRFDNLAEFELIDLDKRLSAFSEYESETETNATKLVNSSDAEKAQNMLDMVKSKLPILSKTNNSKSDNLLLDYLMDTLNTESDKDLMQAVEVYVTGQGKKKLLDWRIQESRKGYIKDMERDGVWKFFDEHKSEVGIEIEGGIWNTLVDDLVYELVNLK